MALRRFNTAAGVHTKTGYEPAELIDPQTPGNPMMILQLGLAVSKTVSVTEVPRGYGQFLVIASINVSLIY